MSAQILYLGQLKGTFIRMTRVSVPSMIRKLEATATITPTRQDIYVDGVTLEIACGGVALSDASAIAAWRASRAAGRSADAAEESALESRKARQDRLGSNVFVQVVRGVGTRWISQAVGVHVQFAKPLETRLETTGNDEVRVLLGAIIRVENHGSSPASVVISALRVDSLIEDDIPSLELEFPPFDSLNAIVPDSHFTISPGAQRVLLVRAGPTLREWLHSRTSQVIVGISAGYEPEGSYQHWELSLYGPLLGPFVGNESTFLIQPHRMVETHLANAPRTYPKATE